MDFVDLYDFPRTWTTCMWIDTVAGATEPCFHCFFAFVVDTEKDLVRHPDGKQYVDFPKILPWSVHSEDESTEDNQIQMKCVQADGE